MRYVRFKLYTPPGMSLWGAEGEVGDIKPIDSSLATRWISAGRVEDVSAQFPTLPFNGPTDGSYP